jgi:hypothetical protein
VTDTISPSPPQDHAIANTLPRNKWAQRITDAWQAQVPSIFEVGSLLEAAKAELRHGAWIGMAKADLPFSLSTANQLMKIARCDHLRNSQCVTNLPAHWGTLFELTLLTASQFESGIASGKINPRMQRRDVKALRGDAKPAPATISPSFVLRFSGGVFPHFWGFFPHVPGLP